MPLYTIDRARSYGRLDPLFSGAIDVEIVREQWDSLVRVASSLKDRKEHAHVLLERLIANERSDRLAKALAMLGRITRGGASAVSLAQSIAKSRPAQRAAYFCHT